jgi:preprotein translocase subunit SecB
MSDETSNEVAQAAPEASQSELNLQNIYIKDASFEAPNGPNLQVSEWNPQFGMNMNTSASLVAENVHEVVLSITLEAKVGDKVAYLAEVKQAGLFLIRGFEVEDLRRILGAFCPNTLFPYVRASISDLVAKGGFPPFLLPPVNFDQLFAQSMEAAARQAQQGTVN